MSSSRLVKTMLQYGVDEGSISRVVASTRRVDNVLREVQATAGRTGRSSIEASQGFARMASAEDRAAASTIKLSQALTTAQREAARLNREMQRGSSLSVTGGGVGSRGGRAGNRLERIGREIVGVPDIGPSTDIGQFLRLIGAAGGSFATMGAALAIAGPAAVLLAVGIADFMKQIDSGKRILTAAIEAQKNYYEALENSTTEEATRQIDELTRRQTFLRQRIEETSGAVEQSFANSSAQFGDAATRIGDVFGLTPGSVLGTGLRDLQAEFLANEQTVTRLTQGLEANVFATNDAANAEERLLEARQRSAELSISSSLRARQQSRTLTGEDARQLLEDLQYEFDLLNGSSAEGAAKRLQEISYEMIRLEETVIPAVAAREREEQATQDLTDRIEMATDATERHAAETEKLADIQAKISDAQADSTAKLAQIEADLRDKRADIETNYQDKLAEIELDGTAKREEINEDYHERVRRATAIAANALLMAVGERDALAAFMADQNRKSEIDEAKNDRKRAENDLVRDLKRQTSLAAKERGKQLEIAAKAAQRAIEIEVARANAQLSALQQTFNAQQAIVADWAQKIINYTYAVQAAAAGLLGGKGGVTTKPASSFGSFTTGTKTQINANYVPSGGYVGAGGGAIGGYGGGIGFGGFYANGGYPPVGRRVLVGENGPEIAEFKSPVHIYNNSETKRMMGGGGFSVGTMIFNGRTRRELHREFDKYVTQAMELG
jgi:hypothetical protein